MNCRPEEGGSMFIRNIGAFNHYRVQTPKTWSSYDYQQPSWKPEDLQYGASYSVLWAGCNMQHARQKELLNGYQHFSPKPWKEEKSLNVGRCILLKWTLRTSNARMWTGIVWRIRALRKSGPFQLRRPDVSGPRNKKRKALEASPAWSDAMDQAGTQAYTEEVSPSYKSGTQDDTKLATDKRTCKLIVIILVIWPWRMLRVTTGGSLLCRW